MKSRHNWYSCEIKGSRLAVVSSKAHHAHLLQEERKKIWKKRRGTRTEENPAVHRATLVGVQARAYSPVLHKHSSSYVSLLPTQLMHGHSYQRVLHVVQEVSEYFALRNTALQQCYIYMSAVPLLQRRHWCILFGGLPPTRQFNPHSLDWRVRFAFYFIAKPAL